jgi:hypothetical protein
MHTYINPKITIVEPVKNRNYGYYTVLEKDNTNVLKIKSKSASGRKRGVVGEILRDGSIKASDDVMKYMTKEVKQKIKMVVELIYTSNSTDLKIKNGLVTLVR